MIKREVTVLASAVSDLREAIGFYERRQEKLGDYFIDSIIVDLESLSFYGGIHAKTFGFYRKLAKRFPFAIYYTIKDNSILVAAVLDMRRKPAWNRNQLRRRRR